MEWIDAIRALVDGSDDPSATLREVVNTTVSWLDVMPPRISLLLAADVCVFLQGCDAPPGCNLSAEYEQVLHAVENTMNRLLSRKHIPWQVTLEGCYE